MLPAKWVDFLDTKDDPNAVVPKADLNDVESADLLGSGAVMTIRAGI